MKNSFPILYITYDGLLDPLGRSQIIPYIYGISIHSSPIHILSFEKLERFSEEKNNLKLEFISRGINWHPLIFSRNKGYFGGFKKIWDFFRMYLFAWFISVKYEIKIVHARSHVPGWVALSIKRVLGTPFIFDCRGLWVDERVDKGSWNLENYFHIIQYNYLKAKERALFQSATHIVVLTKRIIPELIIMGVNDTDKITVIPCCADFNHFKHPTSVQKINKRKQLGIPEDSLVLGYLGSVGKMYKIDWYLKLFEVAASSRENVIALVVTHDVFEINEKISSLLPNNLKNRLLIVTANRRQVPEMLISMDLLISFYLPSFARIAQSPTKNAEALAVGIPIISNIGVGDVEEILISLNAGISINPDIDFIIEKTVKSLDQIKALGGSSLRKRAESYYSLNLANKAYESIYQKLKLD
jgi:glycosyltransferase involved in cell wall biosynthesis